MELALMVFLKTFSFGENGSFWHEIARHNSGSTQKILWNIAEWKRPRGAWKLV